MDSLTPRLLLSVRPCAPLYEDCCPVGGVKATEESVCPEGTVLPEDEGEGEEGGPRTTDCDQAQEACSEEPTCARELDAAMSGDGAPPREGGELYTEFISCTFTASGRPLAAPLCLLCDCVTVRLCDCALAD